MAVDRVRGETVGIDIVAFGFRPDLVYHDPVSLAGYWSTLCGQSETVRSGRFGGSTNTISTV